LSSYFHCSIIGTCLTTTELRQILVKMRLVGAEKETDHELHGRAVHLAGRKELALKLLQKALDRRHHSAITQFNKAKTADELQALWNSALQRAEIPGTYWAVLTHPETTEDLVRKVFGEVHMLSHLVGAANRADIRRLSELQAENAALHEKVARQQQALRDAVLTRDATIASLSDRLSQATATTQQGVSSRDLGDDYEQATTGRLISGLRRRLASEAARREKSEARLRELSDALDAERKQSRILEQTRQELSGELAAAERALSAQFMRHHSSDEPSQDLARMTLLYVGGRTKHVAHLRLLAEQRGAALLHHDGGIDDRSGLLEAHVARADVVVFPVDCVSHNAVTIIKRVSRQLARPFIALRSSGLTSFAAALSRLTQQRTDMRPGERSLTELNV
jgi:Uncharacterized protein conserved in bacteria (DUF2325)